MSNKYKGFNFTGWKVEDDEYVGKQFRFKNIQYPWENGVHTIVGKQKMFGYDETGKYDMIIGYRCASENIPLGKTFQLHEVDIIE